MTESLYKAYLEATGVSTDTRSIEKGNLFFALKGPNFNANAFAEQALEKGALYAVVDDVEYAKDDRYLVVDDGLKALQELALHHRRRLDIPVLALTGSNGKTTTKELIRTVLSAKYRVSATKGNLNNHIGVPLTILRLPKDTEIAVVEMGANKVGDIKELVEIAEPTHGLITNIGRAHLEGFGGFEGVLRGKTELFDFLLKNDGQVFINSQDPVLSNMTKRFTSKKPVLFPAKGDFYSCRLLGADPYVKIETEDGETVRTHLLGAYNYNNAAVALCVGKYFEVPASDANAALESYIPANNRSQIIERNSSRIILDAYNANPDSMKAALANLQAMDGSNKVVILGDMFELGEESEERHREIGEAVKPLGLHSIIFCGEHMAAAAEAEPEASYFKTREELTGWLKGQHFKEATILIKGSRGMKLETVMDVLKAD